MNREELDQSLANDIAEMVRALTVRMEGRLQQMLNPPELTKEELHLLLIEADKDYNQLRYNRGLPPLDNIGRWKYEALKK